MSSVIEQTNLEHVLVGTGSAPCMSILHQEEGAPTHEAHYYAKAPCGDTLTVCAERKRRARQHGGWSCRFTNGRGCTAWHPYDHLEFRRI